jgi:hypothetical protein
MTQPSSLDLALQVIDALNEAGVGYMLVGSFSSNFYAPPRSTKDMDVVVAIMGDEITRLARRLAPVFTANPQASFEAVTGTRRYRFRSRESLFEVEFFDLGSDPHDQARFERRLRVTFEGRETFIPRPEDVIVTKLRWALGAKRAKDRDDVRNVIAVNRAELDWQYIHRWADSHGTRALLDEIASSVG